MLMFLASAEEPVDGPRHPDRALPLRPVQEVEVDLVAVVQGLVRVVADHVHLGPDADAARLRTYERDSNLG